MKKLFLFMAVSALTAAFAVSCNKTVTSPEVPEGGSVGGDCVNGLVCDFNLDGDSSYKSSLSADGVKSKAVKTEWIEGDVVFVFVDGVTDDYIRLTNTGNEESPWKLSCGPNMAEELPVGNVTVNVIHVPFADETVVPSFSDGKWTINTGDVYFTSVKGAEATVTLIEEDMKKLEGNITLQRYPGYVQIYVEKDVRFPDNPVFQCNQLDRFTSVTFDASNGFQPVPAEDNVRFTSRPLFKDQPDGLVFYGILKAAQAPDTEFKADGGLDSEGKPLSARSFTYEIKNKTLSAKAYRILYADSSVKMGKWTSTLCAVYNVNDDGGKVVFTPGNLRCSNALKPHWCFAPSQKDIIGRSQILYLPAPVDAKIYFDNFQWGATGTCSSSSTITYEWDGYQLVALPPFVYAKGPRGYRADLITDVKDCAFCYTTGDTLFDSYRSITVPANGDDWGANEIEYSAPNTYRTLTANEWNYIATNYTSARTSIDGVKGWAIVKEGSIATSYTSAQWAEAERTRGAVFFPKAGMRAGCEGFPQYDGIDIWIDGSLDRKDTDDEAYKYWTSSVGDELKDVPSQDSALPGTYGLLPIAVYFRSDGETGLQTHVQFPWRGFSVRLVKDVK